MTVAEQLKQHQPTDFNFSFHIAENEAVGIDGINPYNFFSMYYGNWYCIGDILQKWELYNTLYLEGFARSYIAITAEYNPINNYDMTEMSTSEINDGVIKETRETDLTDTLESSVNVNTTTTNTPNTTRAHSVNTYDAGNNLRVEYNDADTGSNTTSTIADKDSNISTGSNTTKGKVTTTTEHTAVSVGDLAGDRVEKHSLNRSGNIGVTTSAQMVTGELNLRARSIESEYYQRFAIENFFYAGD